MKNSVRFSAMMFLIITGLLGACKTVSGPASDADQFIQGEWTYSEEVDEGFYASYSYTFDGGLVQFSGYPPLEWHGRYRILAADNNLLTLELFDLEYEDGPRDSYTIELEYDSAQDTLMIGSTGPFAR